MHEPIHKKETKDQKEDRAVLLAIEVLQKRFTEKHIRSKSFTTQGKDHKITCSTDCIVADAGLFKEIANELYAEARKKEDYFEEFATAKISTFLDSWFQTASRYAEFDTYYPESSEKLSSLIPTFKTISKEGIKTWEKFHTNKNEK